MAKTHQVDSHPEELFSLSGPMGEHTKKFDYWTCLDPRDVARHMAMGDGWDYLGSPCSEGPLEFGRLTYMGPKGSIELTSLVNNLWLPYFESMQEAVGTWAESHVDEYENGYWPYHDWTTWDCNRTTSSNELNKVVNYIWAEDPDASPARGRELLGVNSPDASGFTARC